MGTPAGSTTAGILHFLFCQGQPQPRGIGTFPGKGRGTEIASSGEFLKALSAGCPPERMVCWAPGKTPAELELVVKHGIGEIHIESTREAERIAAIANNFNVEARVAIRVNPSGEAEGGAMRMGGRPAPFGVDEECLDEVLDAMLALDSLDIRRRSPVYRNANPGLRDSGRPISKGAGDREPCSHTTRQCLAHRGLRRRVWHSVIPQTQARVGYQESTSGPGAVV